MPQYPLVCVLDWRGHVEHFLGPPTIGANETRTYLLRLPPFFTRSVDHALKIDIGHDGQIVEGRRANLHTMANVFEQGLEPTLIGLIGELVMRVRPRFEILWDWDECRKYACRVGSKGTLWKDRRVEQKVL